MAQHEPQDFVVTQIDLANRDLLANLAEDVFDEQRVFERVLREYERLLQ